MVSDSPALTLADGRIVECGQTLRSLPEKRRVYAGRFDGRPVIVKVFLDRRRARVHFQRELDGLHAFHNAGIAAPEVLYAGSDGDGRPVIILARLGDAVLAAQGTYTDSGLFPELLALYHLFADPAMTIR